MKVYLPSILLFLVVLAWMAWDFFSVPALKKEIAPVLSAEKISPQTPVAKTQSVPVFPASPFVPFPPISPAVPAPKPVKTLSFSNSPFLSQADLPKEAGEVQSYPSVPVLVKDSQGRSNPVALPLVWQDPSPDVSWSNEQIEAFRSLWDKFVEDVGGAGQDPSDPAYQERWNEAQRESDLSFKALFGKQAYNAHQIQALGSGSDTQP